VWVCSERLSATGNMRHDIILLTRHQVFICEYSNRGRAFKGGAFRIYSTLRTSVKLPLRLSRHTPQRVGVNGGEYPLIVNIRAFPQVL
jgi:hypothetical protein